MLTFQKQGGCAASPLTVQAVAGEQEALPAEPPEQKAPMGQMSVAVGEVDPGGQKKPGAAVHAPEQAGDERPGVLPKVPAGQGEQAAEPKVEYVPGVQGLQVLLFDAPIVAL